MLNAFHSTKTNYNPLYFCPHCEEYMPVTIENISETINVLSEPINTNLQVLQCETCSNEFTTLEIEEENFKRAYDIYREKHNLILPDKIKEIRLKLNLFPFEFGLLIGLNENSINNIEKGFPFDDEINDKIKAIQETGKALNILNEKQKNLPEEIYLSIKDKLEKAVKGVRTPSIDYYSIDGDKQDLETGYKRFNIDKVENLILYILLQIKNVSKTKLNKLLFYCDFKYFKENSVSITGIKYVHLPLGPIPDNYEIIINNLIIEGKINSNEIIYCNIQGECVGEIYEPLIKPDLSLFTENEIKIIDESLSVLNNLSATQIKNKSHNEQGYNETNRLETISYRYAESLSI